MSHILHALDLSAGRPCWGRLEGAEVAGGWLRVVGDTPEQVAASLRAQVDQPGDLVVLLGLKIAQVAFFAHESLPPKAGKEILLAQAARLLRATPDTVTVDFQRAPDGVALAAARTEPVASLRAALESVGFRVTSAEPASASFIRALATQDPILAVRLGDGEAEMVAAQGHRFWFSRRCSWGGLDALALEIAETVRGHRAPDGLEVVFSGLGAEEAVERLQLPWPHRLAATGPDLGIDAQQHLVPAAGALVGQASSRRGQRFWRSK